MSIMRYVGQGMSNKQVGQNIMVEFKWYFKQENREGNEALDIFLGEKNYKYVIL